MDEDMYDDTKIVLKTIALVAIAIVIAVAVAWWMGGQA